MINFSLLQNVERPVSPHGEVRVFATVPRGLPVCCEGEVAAVGGRDDQSPGGASGRKHQTPPPTGHQTRHAWHKKYNPNQNPSATRSRLSFPTKEKGRKKKRAARSEHELIALPVMPQMQHCFILLDLVLISALPLPLQRLPALTEKPITWEKVQVPTETTRHCGPDPPSAHRAQQTCSGTGLRTCDLCPVAANGSALLSQGPDHLSPRWFRTRMQARLLFPDWE